MSDQISIYEPRTMLAAIQNMMPVHTFLKDTFFGDQSDPFPTEEVDVDYYKGKRLMAPFVSPRLPGVVREREGFKTKSYKPPLVKPARIFTADDLKKRQMGETIYSGRTPASRELQMLAQDLADMDAEITRREEWMCAQALFEGKIHMIGDGVDQILDFEFDNKEILSGTDKWDNPDSDPIAYLKSKRLAVIQKSGITPDIVVMASDVVDAFIRHPEVQKLLDNRRIVMGQIDPRALPNGVTYIGQLSSLGLDIYSYDEWYVDEETDPKNPTEKPMVPPGTILLGSSRSRSKILYGAITVIDPNTKKFVTYQGERIPRTWVKEEPSVRYIQINSRPLPVPYEIDSWYVSKVI